MWNKKNKCADYKFDVIFLFLSRCTSPCTGKYKQRWLVLKETCLFFLSPETGEVRAVMLMDTGFQVSHGYRLLGVRNGLLISNLTRYGFCGKRFFLLLCELISIFHSLYNDDRLWEENTSRNVHIIDWSIFILLIITIWSDKCVINLCYIHFSGHWLLNVTRNWAKKNGMHTLQTHSVNIVSISASLSCVDGKATFHGLLWQ